MVGYVIERLSAPPAAEPGQEPPSTRRGVSWETHAGPLSPSLPQCSSGDPAGRALLLQVGRPAGQTLNCKRGSPKPESALAGGGALEACLGHAGFLGAFRGFLGGWERGRVGGGCLGAIPGRGLDASPWLPPAGLFPLLGCSWATLEAPKAAPGGGERGGGRPPRGPLGLSGGIGSAKSRERRNLSNI